MMATSKKGQQRLRAVRVTTAAVEGEPANAMGLAASMAARWTEEITLKQRVLDCEDQRRAMYAQMQQQTFALDGGRVEFGFDLSRLGQFMVRLTVRPASGTRQTILIDPSDAIRLQEWLAQQLK
jgi:membrane protein YdbS with pleckstrin-like domain